MSNKTRFDLEQDIMKCWAVIDDLNIIYSSEHLYEDENEMQNALMGLHSLYKLKFDRLWATFEECISKGEI